MRGILPIIPPRSNRKAPEHPDYRRYQDRNRIELMFGKLKQQRRIATRYDKSILSFESFLNLATVRLWLQSFVNAAEFDNQSDLDVARLVFIDETSVSTKMARLRGRSRRGTHCRMSVPHGHWKITTFIGGLRLSGMTAPMMLDGPMTCEWVAAYARKVLAPTLSPGDAVIQNNLPPYSPDFNSIETIFAKMQAWIRRGAPRPTDALQDAVCSAIDDVCHRLTVACFASAGYDPDRSDYALDLHDTAICLRGFLARRHFGARREVCSTWQRLA